MKHLSRKYKKRTLRKSRVFRKKNRKTVAKKRIYKKRNTRKRRKVGGMETEEDIEVGRIKSIVQPKPRVPFININDPSIMESGILKPPTPSAEPFMSSWQGAPRTSKQNLKKYMEKGDFSKPPLTNSQEDRELLKAFVPEVFENSDNEFKTPRSSVSSGSYGTPRSQEETDPIWDIYNFESPEQKRYITNLLKQNDTSSDEESEDEETRKATIKRNLKATMKDFGINSSDSD